MEIVHGYDKDSLNMLVPMLLENGKRKLGTPLREVFPVEWTDNDGNLDLTKQLKAKMRYCISDVTGVKGQRT